MKRQLAYEAFSDLEEAFRGKLWAFAPVVMESCCGLGVAVANEAGYSPISPTRYAVGSYDDAADEADRLNRLRGMDEAAAARIVLSSMAAGKVKKEEAA